MNFGGYSKWGVGVLYFYLDFTWKQAHNSIGLACKTSLLLLLPQIISQHTARVLVWRGPHRLSSITAAAKKSIVCYWYYAGWLHVQRSKHAEHSACSPVSCTSAQLIIQRHSMVMKFIANGVPIPRLHLSLIEVIGWAYFQALNGQCNN